MEQSVKPGTVPHHPGIIPIGLQPIDIGRIENAAFAVFEVKGDSRDGMAHGRACFLMDRGRNWLKREEKGLESPKELESLALQTVMLSPA